MYQNRLGIPDFVVLKSVSVVLKLYASASRQTFCGDYGVKAKL